MASKLLVNELQAATGTDITITAGHSLVAAASVFKIAGGIAGQALITDGAGNISFGTVSSLPTQSGQAGKFLKTDGTDASWGTVATDPTMGGDLTGTASNAQIAANAVGVAELDVTDGTDGQALMTDGSGTMTFGDVDALPAQTSNAGKFLTTDGTDPSWGALSVTAAAVSDQANTATTYFDVPAGTTAQRPGSPASGNMRFNSETNEMEHYSGTGWIGFAGSVPIVTSIGPTTSPEAGTTITINGSNFSGSSTVRFIGTDNSEKIPQTVTFVDVNTLSVTTPDLPVSLEPYDVKVTNPDVQTYTLVDSLDAGGVPVWTTPVGSIGTMFDVVTTPGLTHFTLVATDPDGSAITYTETTSVLATAGLTLNSATGAITGNAPTTQAPNGSTIYNFDVEASDGLNITARSFSVTLMDVPTGGDTTGTYTVTGQGYTSHTFLSSGSFYNAADLTCDIMVVAGGGAGGNSHTSNGNGGGGGGGMVVATGHVLPAGTHTITVGAGGARSGGGSNSPGNDGNNSVVISTPTLTAVGGGGGGGNHSSTTGRDGGSGGGASRQGAGISNGLGGSTTQDSAGTQHNPANDIAAYGNIGGNSFNINDWVGAGGGGAGSPGYGYGGSAPYNHTSSGTSPGGNGGLGKECNLRDGGFAAGNTNLFYAGGGGGGGNSTEHAGDGYHGGGRGYGTTPSYPYNSNPAEVNSTTLGSGSILAIANTGGGGGAGSYWANNVSTNERYYGSGTGGSGIVVIRYKAQ